jgi:23S rRNA (uracil1939-C5)-methyltransferase
VKTAAPSDLVDLTIESLDAAGDGIAPHRGRRVSVPFTIPGERVRAILRSSRGDDLSADVVDILAPSPHRVVPRCRHFGPPADAVWGAPSGSANGPCGGCTWQHIAYPEQLRLKTALVDRLVRSGIPQAPAARETITGTDEGDPWGYRHKVHFVFGNGAALTMGHYARGSRRIVAVRECPVHDERGNVLAFRLRDACSRAHVAAADGQQRGRASSGVLRGIAIRAGCNTPELLATLVVNADTDKRLRTATRRALDEEVIAPTALHLNLHPRDDGLIFGRETRRLSGSERMRERVGDTSFLISPTVFFQTNIRAAEVLVQLVLEAVPDGVEVLDLYAGAGLFALPLARRGHRVTAIEENRAAVADGEASQRLNRIARQQCRFIARSVEAALRGRPAAGVVILDPPREGCSAQVIEDVFGEMRPARAVYVSCNPEALARDLCLIARHRYEIVSVQPVDMFPHTAHVETVVLLDRAVASPKRR